jgi:penicillin-binding protein 1A
MRPATQIKLLWIAFLSAIGLFVFYVYAVSVDLLGLFGGMPPLESLENPKSEIASEIYSSDGAILGKYYRENRTPVAFEEISPNLIKALYATEDVRFDEHSGVDMKGTLAIAWYIIKGDKRGSSTISQQLAKNLFATRGEAYESRFSSFRPLRMLITKTKEWIVAIRLEKAYTKKEIITMYLNTVDFGSNAFGIKVAAKTFFGTTPGKLTVPQAATLVGVLKGPSWFSPVSNPERSAHRRNTVIEQMEKYQFLTSEEAENYKGTPLALNYSVDNHNDGMATYYRSYIQPYLIRWARENGYDLYADGLRIYTTLDSRMQHYAEEAVAEHMKVLQDKFFKHWKGRRPWVDEQFKEIPGFIEAAAKRSGRYKEYLAQHEGDHAGAMKEMNKPIRMRLFTWDDPNSGKDTVISPMDSIRYVKHILQAGMMSMDPVTGEIKAWVGGINHKFFKYDHVRQGKRQPGSIFKAFVYASAIDLGYSPCYEVVDLPTTFFQDTTEYTPDNFEKVFTGERMTLRKALAQSKNSIAAFLIKKLGPNTVVDMARRLGVESRLDAVPSLAFGTSDVSVYEMVGAYSTFVNEGTWTEPFTLVRIEDKYGQVLKRFNPKKVEALNPETAYLMVHMLKGATQEENGTALGLYSRSTTLKGGNEVAAKTGTTSNYSDGWFLGMTHNLVTGVWVGAEDRAVHFRTGDEGQGARLAMPIWAKYMDKVYADPKTGVERGQFKKPANLSVNIDCRPIEQDSLDSVQQVNHNPDTYVIPKANPDLEF